MIRVILPLHLQTLARVNAEVQLDLKGSATIESALDALEANYPMLRGTIRDHVSKQRRPFLRYFAAGQDFSLDSSDTRLPDEIVTGKEPFIILGAIAGG